MTKNSNKKGLPIFLASVHTPHRWDGGGEPILDAVVAGPNSSKVRKLLVERHSREERMQKHWRNPKHSSVEKISPTSVYRKTQVIMSFWG